MICNPLKAKSFLGKHLTLTNSKVNMILYLATNHLRRVIIELKYLNERIIK